MIRLTEPTPCPRCRRLVVPGETRWYDLLDDGLTAGDAHVCHPPTCRGEVQPDLHRARLEERFDFDEDNDA